MWFDFFEEGAAATLQHKFDYYNDLLFAQGVPPCPLAFVDLNDMVGSTCYQTKGDRVVPGSVRIEISTHFKITEEMLDATLVHEMIHAYLAATQADPDPNHSMAFRMLCETLGRRAGFPIPVKDDFRELELTNPVTEETLVVLRANKRTGENEATFLAPSIAGDERQMQQLFDKYKPYFQAGYDVDIFTTETTIFGWNFHMVTDVANGDYYSLKPGTVAELRRNAHYIRRWLQF